MTKRITLIVLSILLLFPAAVFGEQEDRETGVLPCTFIAPQEVTYTEHLSDGDPFTTVTLRKNETLTMQFPNGAAPAGLISISVPPRLS